MSLLSFEDIARIFEEIELRLIASLKRNLSRHKQEEQKEGFEWSSWQAEKLKNIDSFRRENLDIVNEYVDVIDSDTRRLMAEQFNEGERLAEESVSESEPITEPMSAPPSEPPEPPTSISDEHFFGVNAPKMEKLIEDITTVEKKVETAAVRTMDDVYRTTLNKVQLAMGSGSMTLTEAIDIATREFLDKGINSIVYSDGKRVNISDYVRMALRTTSTRAQLQGKAKRFAELGYDTVLVSQYGGCSKTCEPWQGKVYIDDVFTVWDGEISGDFGKSKYCGKWFMLLSVAVRAGLFHPNCRHTITQYIDGRTKIPAPIPVDKIKQQRELEQKQRAMERKIRALKRKAEGTQDEKKAKEYRKKVREAQSKLKEFVSEHNDALHRDYSREKIYGGTDLITNKAKGVELFNAVDVPASAEITSESIKAELEKSIVGRDTLKYLEETELRPKLIYERQWHSNRGEQRKDDIMIFISNINNDVVAAQTIIHEVTHQRYGIGQCQWAEAICMAKEKLHIVNRDYLTISEKRYIVGLARKHYGEYNWKKGGTLYGRRI